MANAKVWGGWVLKSIKLETEVRNIVDNMLHTCKYCPVFNLKKEFQQTI